jgi:hypothetical protein
MSCRSSLTMRLCRLAFTATVFFLATPVVAEPAGTVTAVANNSKPQEPETDIFALMTGRCSTLKIAGRAFACKTVGFFHNEEGRTNFTVAVDDPADNSHVISFSGENGRRNEDNLFDLPIDRMLLSSKDRPKADGLPVPSAQAATGTCRQVGNFALLRVSSISCSATDQNGKNYELQFESDGSPMIMRRVRQYSLAAKKPRARQSEQIECRYRAAIARVPPRDQTDYILQCLAQLGEKSPTPTQP